MAGVRDIGSLDNDRSFVSSLASGVSNVANSLADTFKDRVQAIYPGSFLFFIIDLALKYDLVL